MAEFIHSSHASRVAVGGSAIDMTYVMPVLPLSHIWLTIDCQLTVAHTTDNWLSALSNLRSIQFRWRGTQIWALQAVDLYRMARAAAGISYRPEVVGMAANARRLLMLCIPFGRQLYNPNECFPAVNKGETELYLSWTAPQNGYTGFVFSIESVQLPGANPKQFMRCTTISATPAATGDVDYDLPRAAPLSGLGYVVTASEPTNALATIERLKILANNQDQHYSQVSNNVARAQQCLRDTIGYEWDSFAHEENQAGAYAQYATTDSPLNVSGMYQEFGWLPFDVNMDGMYALQGPSYQDLKARINFNTAAAVRLLPLEIWTPSMFQRSGQTAAVAGK